MAHEFKKESLNQETLVEHRLPCKQNPPFVFAHSPDNWELLDDGDGGFTMLPRIKCMRLEPGVNGIRGESYSTVRPAMFFANLRSEGWVVITNNVPVVYYDDGELVEDHGYLGSRPCRAGKVYCSVWDHPIISGAGRKAKVDWKTKKDLDGFNEWKLMLVASGIIPKPTEGGLNELIRRQTRRARRQAGKTGGNKYLEELVAKETAKLDAMIKSKAEMYKALPKKKKRKSGKMRKETLDLEQ